MLFLLIKSLEDLADQAFKLLISSEILFGQPLVNENSVNRKLLKI